MTHMSVFCSIPHRLLLFSHAAFRLCHRSKAVMVLLQPLQDRRVAARAAASLKHACMATDPLGWVMHLNPAPRKLQGVRVLQNVRAARPCPAYPA